MSVQTEITRIEAAKDDIISAIIEKGVEVPDGSKLEVMAGLIRAIVTGGGFSIELPSGYAMEMGIYIPDTDKSSAVTIDLQNTFRWNDTGKTSACYLLVVGVDIRKGTQAAALGAHVKFGVGERNHQMVTTTSGCSTSSTIFMNPATTGTFSQITITGTGSYPLKAGHSYLWMVIGELVA